MMKFSRYFAGLFAVVLGPVGANAAGTYYTGGYQSPQTRYAQQSYSQRVRNQGASSYGQQGVSAYNRQQYAKAGYVPVQQQQSGQVDRKQGNVVRTTAQNKGLTIGAGISRQTAMWQFEMKSAESVLHYDNLDWNVFDVNAMYDFQAGKVPVQIAAGFKYGMQAGESTMIDDDITNGGYFVTDWWSADALGNPDEYLGDQVGHTLSIGTSKKGSLMEFNAGVGLKDFFKWGKVKFTPSIGWRYLKYELETHNNHGMSIDTYTGLNGCFTVEGANEVQCDPILIFYDSNGAPSVVTRTDTNGDDKISAEDAVLVPSGAVAVSVGNSYYYMQPSVSHKYEVAWSGPYLALDMLYDINANNSFSARVELGLPSYTATGDQPYRFDWEHPKSVEDTAGLGGAFHLGAGASWSTALTDKISLSVGVTYDYYSVADADAETYLSSDYYMGVYNEILNDVFAGDEEKMLAENKVAQSIVKLQEDCPGWVCKDGGEIESFYKSLGVRVGINAKF